MAWCQTQAVFVIINMVPCNMGTVYMGTVVRQILLMQFVNKVCDDFHKAYTDPRKKYRR